MATPKALRSAPQKYLDGYVASIKKLQGPPASVEDTTFSEQSYLSNGTLSYGASRANIQIGFTFKVNGKNYTQIFVSEYGFAVLQEPGYYFDLSGSDVISGLTYDNTSLLTNFVRNHIVLAPWWDRSITPSRDIETLSTTSDYNSTITAQVIEDVNQGKDVRNWPFDYIDRGARCCNFYDPQNGKGFIVRWTTYYGSGLVSLALGGIVVKWKFELVLFENGKIEFRYWPVDRLEPGDLTAYFPVEATTGIFWSGPEFGSNKFRDFAPLIDYRKDTSRKISSLGGASYDVAYSESGSPYSISIDENYWPRNGAVISFIPPSNLAKFLPRKLAKDTGSSKQIVRSPGVYDDRKTFSFFTGSTNAATVYMPSTLSTRLHGDSGETNIEALQTLIGTTGSITVQGKQNKASIDSLMDQLELIESRKPHDNSFNESQKNYKTIASSNFYSNNSSLSLFGEGFAQSLNSKTQFHLSLPVNKKSVMPSTSPSVYYYDAYKKCWVAMDPNGHRNPESTTVSLAGEADDIYYYRVTETSRGFDAVGRKITSGSRVNNLNPSTAGVGSIFQTDDIFGTVFNRTISASYSQTSVQKALNKSYRNSITDNPKFFPDSTKQIQFSVDEPFLIEKVVVNLPLYADNEWFKDVTSCNRAYGDSTPVDGVASGAIDFGGPGLTFSIFCPRKSGNVTYMDLITSGTITHHIDNKSEVLIKKDPDQKYYSIRPVGFLAFSNPTAVVSGVWNGSQHVFDGKVKLEMEASVAGGVTFARNDRSQKNTNANYVASNASKAEKLLTTKELSVNSGETYNAYDIYENNVNEYEQRSARVYIQQVSPLARGTSRQEFNGNSILGGNIAYSNVESFVKNPLYVSESLGKLPSEFQTILGDPTFNFDAVSLYSTVDSRPAPYLVMPGDKLTFCVSKTRPVIDRMALSSIIMSTYYDFSDYTLTGSHDAVVLNTGSIDVTIYGSYVREGVEYHR